MTSAAVNNLTRGSLLVLNALVPETQLERSIGLLGHKTLDLDSGLILLDCSAIHTVGMRFPIDVCFCNGRGRVMFAATCQPGNRNISVNGARWVLEAPPGRMAVSLTQLGDRLQIDFRG